MVAFLVYNRESRPKTITTLKVDGLRLFCHYRMSGENLHGSAFSNCPSLHKVAYRIVTKEDERQTKTAHSGSLNLTTTALSESQRKHIATRRNLAQTNGDGQE
jgi:hypothetical protein